MFTNLGYISLTIGTMRWHKWAWTANGYRDKFCNTRSTRLVYISVLCGVSVFWSGPIVIQFIAQLQSAWTCIIFPLSFSVQLTWWLNSFKTAFASIYSNEQQFTCLMIWFVELIISKIPPVGSSKQKPLFILHWLQNYQAKVDNKVN